MDSRQNVYGMLLDVQRESGEGQPCELFIVRNSWGPRTVCMVLAAEPEPDCWVQLGLEPPYFGNPDVFGVVHWTEGDRYEGHFITCAGTYAYRRVERPSWFRVPPGTYSARGKKTGWTASGIDD